MPAPSTKRISEMQMVKRAHYRYSHKMVREDPLGDFVSLCTMFRTCDAKELVHHAYLNNATVVTCRSCLRYMAEQRDALNTQIGGEKR